MPLDDQAQTRLVLAALFAALARTFRAQDESFPSRFEDELERLYYELDESDSPPIGAMETLRWTRQLLREPTAGKPAQADE
jgi:hypothetical protein